MTIEIIKGRIHWYEGYSNDPHLELLLSRDPEPEEYTYEQRGNLYYGEVEGVCSFYSQRPGGQHWSANSTAINAAGFGPCTEASIITDPKGYERGYTFRAGAVTMEMLGRFFDRIEVPPYRFLPEEPWCWTTRGFTHRIVFPEGSRFTMVQTDPPHGRINDELSAEQAKLLGQSATFIPIVALPNGKYWLKPKNNGYVTDQDIPEGATVEKIK